MIQLALGYIQLLSLVQLPCAYTTLKTMSMLSIRCIQLLLYGTIWEWRMCKSGSIKANVLCMLVSMYWEYIIIINDINMCRVYSYSQVGKEMYLKTAINISSWQNYQLNMAPVWSTRQLKREKKKWCQSTTDMLQLTWKGWHLVSQYWNFF